jgi:hypothetical protein
MAMLRRNDACRLAAPKRERAKAGGIMPRKLVGGLIQAAAPLTDPSTPIDKIRQAVIDAHIPLIEDAGQDAYWYDIAEAVPGPTTELIAQCAKKHQMAMVEAPWNIGRFYGSSYFADPRGNIIAMGWEDKDELVVAEMGLDMIENVRRVWQFYRDRRPETCGSMAEQLP